mmetsp:Transcript_5454/g.5614  ORF Transcript_5454/g.5614 Transcript_5454/m.5614 type:complete len:343 (+) Transcript_5454:112-1140(+)
MARVGPRAKLLAAKIKEDIDAEFKEKEYAATAKKRLTDFSTTNLSTYSVKPTSGSLVLNDPSVRVQTKNANYSTDTGISFYSYSVDRNPDKIGFPITSIGDANPFRRECNFTADLRNPMIVASETALHNNRMPGLHDVKLIKGLRNRLLREAQNELERDTSLPGSVVRLLVCEMRAQDAQNTGSLSIPHLLECMSSRWRVEVTAKEKEALIITFDHDETNNITLKDLIGMIRDAPLSPRNQELIEIAYQSCGASSLTDTLSLTTLRECLHVADVTQALDTHTGLKLSYEDIEEKILSGILLYSCAKDEVDITSFIEYFSDMYAEIRDEEIFEAILRSCWDIA